MEPNHTLLLGMTDEFFAKVALSIIGGLLSVLLTIGVYYLSQISAVIAQLKSAVDTMLERSTNHGQRLDRLESAVFQSERSVS